MSNQPLWQKNSPASIDEKIMNYMAGEDILLDKKLISFDITASKAHVEGLLSIKILTKDESEKIQNCLNELEIEVSNDTFQLTNQFEDGHSAIEFYLTQKLGDLGKKVHAGRSRNDQVLVATRLYLKDTLLHAQTIVKNSAQNCLMQAEKNQSLAMPGYTHLQRAVPSSAGMWFASFAESMIDNLAMLSSTLELIDCNPLGTAAGYGVNLKLNRELTTKKLGFSRLQINPIYAQNSRGKFEISVLSALAQCLLDVRRFSWDLSIFTTQEFDFVTLPDNMTTGSSIMPNKRNPDLIELMRASYSVVQSAIIELQSLLSLPSGYQRDLQMTKAPMIRAITHSLETLNMFNRVVKAMQFKSEVLANAFEPSMFATDFAVELTTQGMPFRTAYQQVAQQTEQLSERNAKDSIQQRTSPGACHNLMLDELKLRLEKIS